MANHRCFSFRIANSAKFLQMPEGPQLLYFHMIIRADDDGVVEAYPLMKLLGSAPDSFKVLEAKGFIKKLNEDQVVVIMDWLEHNKIRTDRKVNSIYLPLLKEKCSGLELINPKPRSDVEDNSRRTDSGQSTDSLSKVKLSQVKLSKDNIISYAKKDKELTDFLYEKVKLTYPRSVAKKTKDQFEKDYKEMSKINKIDKWNYEQIRYVIEWSQADNFWHKNIRSVKKLREQFERLVAEIKSRGEKNRVVKI